MSLRDVVTVVTVSIPERHQLLAEAAASLRAQTCGPVPWLIRVEEPAVWGTAHVTHQRNALLEAVKTPWMAVLDDDDLFDPTYLVRCAEFFDQADIVYSDCRGHPHPFGPFDPVRLKNDSYIDGEACFRVEAVRAVGGYMSDPAIGGIEDWQLYNRLADAGARFHCIPEKLRSHRHEGWRTITN